MRTRRSPAKRPSGRDRDAAGWRTRGALRSLAVVALPGALIALWLALALTRSVDEIFLPRPATLWDRAFTLRSELSGALVISLVQVGWGWLIGAATGIAAGLLFGFSKLARDLFELTLTLIRPVPIFALIPLFVLWFGVGRAPQIALVAFGVFLIVSFSTIEAIRNVPQQYVLAALACGASRRYLYVTVVIPATVPSLVIGVRYGAVAAWGLDVAAEFSGSQQGLGYFMITRGQYLDSAGITLAVLIYCTLAILFDRLLRQVGRRLQRWSPRHTDSFGVQQMLGGTD